MPSAANGKVEKPASSEATDNSPLRQMMTVVEHKIRNLEKRKSKLTSYRDLQKAGKELNGDQKVAVAKYDEVAQTLEFARDLSKQLSGITIAAERDAKKQAKKDAWVRCAAETSKIREVLLILDCLMQMGNPEARDDFLNGRNGAVKLSEADLRILDDLMLDVGFVVADNPLCYLMFSWDLSQLMIAVIEAKVIKYPEVTPKHELNEEGQSAFGALTSKAAEHLYSIVDGKPKEALGTTYARIKEIVSSVHECGYFDKSAEEPPLEEPAPAPAEEPPLAPSEPPAFPAPLPVPPAAAVVPAPAYPLRAMPPITLQEVEHAYFAQQYPQQRPITEVIGSQNFFFLQESELDSPAGTPQPAPPSPPAQIPTQTFINQQFVPLSRVPPEALPQPHFELPPQAYALAPAPAPAPASPPAPAPAPEEPHDGTSPDRAKGQGDGARFRRYNNRGGPPRAANGTGYRPRGPFPGRQGADGYHGAPRHPGEHPARPRQDGGYQPRGKDGYAGRRADYYGNGDAKHEPRDNGEYKPRGRGGRGRGAGGRGRGAPGGGYARPRPDAAAAGPAE